VNQFSRFGTPLKTIAQREILEAAARTANSPLGPELDELIYKEIRWINVQATKIEDARDDALHSPLLGYQRGTPQPIIRPDYAWGHRRVPKSSLDQRRRNLD
jgi:hypothetical protein